MATGLKAIETVYKGYRFRSRTEARWAYFMDKAGVVWTYESEGYDLDGVRYLPDFYLTKIDCWLEVKGVKPAPASPDYEKPRRLAEASGKPVYMVSGEIGPEYEITTFGRQGWGKFRWCVCIRRGCGLVGISRNGNGAALPCSCFRSDEFYRSDDWKVIRDALAGARMERFGV
jgi:hypothetical protein